MSSRSILEIDPVDTARLEAAASGLSTVWTDPDGSIPITPFEVALGKLAEAHGAAGWVDPGGAEPQGYAERAAFHLAGGLVGSLVRTDPSGADLLRSPLERALAAAGSPLAVYLNGDNAESLTPLSRAVARLHDFTFTRASTATYREGEGRGSLPLAGITGQYASTPDSNDLDITGDIELRIEVAMDDWTPASTEALISKLVVGAGNYHLVVLAAGLIRFFSDATSSITSTTTPPFTDGNTYQIRFTLDVDDGASQHVGTFYTKSEGALDADTGWTQLGDPITNAGTVTLDTNSSPLYIGVHGSGTGNELAGNVYRVLVYDGIDGTLVADFNPQRDAWDGATSFDSSETGETWTMNGGTEIAKRENHLSLPGTSGAHASTPDAAALDITGDIDIRLDVLMDDWSPAAASILLAKGSGGGTSYSVSIDAADDQLRFFSGATGTVDSTAAPTVNDGERLQIRVTLDVDNGSGGHTFKFYTRARGGLGDPSGWVQLGSTVVKAGTVTLGDSGTPLRLGCEGDGSGGEWPGRIYRAQVYDGIDGELVADFYPKGDALEGDTSFQSRSTEELWTINGDAKLEQAGLLRIAGNGVPRDEHFVNGVRTTLLEGQRTNLILWSEEFDNAAWLVATNALTITANDLVAPDGTTTADKLEATNNTIREGIRQGVTVTPASVVYVASVFISKTHSGEVTLWTRFTDGTPNNYTVIFNPTTGAFSSPSESGTGVVPASHTYFAEDFGDWWRVSQAGQDGPGDNPTVSLYIYPGGTDIDTNLGYCYAWGAQIEQAATPSSYIPTTSASVTRSEDTLSFGFPAPPQEMSIYLKFLELGFETDRGADYKPFLIGNPNLGSEWVGLDLGGTSYRLRADDGVTNVQSGFGVAPSFGDVIEIVFHLDDTWEVDGELSINGGAVVTTGPTVSAITIPASFSDPSLYLNGYLNKPTFPLQRLIIASGDRSMDEMRAMGGTS